MKNHNYFVHLVLCTLLVSSFSYAQKIEKRHKRLESIAKGMTQGKPIELEALEIRAKIHEPTVIFILDRPKLEIQFQKAEIKFTPRIYLPLVENHF